MKIYAREGKARKAPSVWEDFTASVRGFSREIEFKGLVMGLGPRIVHGFLAWSLRGRGDQLVVASLAEATRRSVRVCKSSCKHMCAVVELKVAAASSRSREFASNSIYMNVQRSSTVRRKREVSISNPRSIRRARSCWIGRRRETERSAIRSEVS